MHATKRNQPPGRRRWALVLAAGDGRRLAHLTRDEAGVETPKQFCSVLGGPTLLQQTVRRAESVVGRWRVATVVAAAHRRWWSRDLEGIPRHNVIVQPSNRGTAAGILLPLLDLADRDPDATVVVMPSDHGVDDERVWRAAMGDVLAEAERDPDAITLLGIAPDHADPDLGWIVPADPARRAGRVDSFVEKPSREVAERLMRLGAVWNAFVFAGRAGTIVDLCHRALPDLTRSLIRARDWDQVHPTLAGAVAHAYCRMEVHDFSREVLSKNPDVLRVLRAPACGWSDLGTPERVRRHAAERRSGTTSIPVGRLALPPLGRPSLLAVSAAGS